jgi:hypothetical protein
MGGPAGGVRGVVADAAGDPVPGARIAFGESGVSTRTDTLGRFSFENVRSGISTDLVVTGPGTATQPITIASGTIADVQITLQPPDVARPPMGLPVVQTAPDTAVIAVSPVALDAVPSIGPDDPARAVQLRPEALGSEEGSAEFIVRGASSDQTLITYDGFTVYPMTNLLSALSAFNGDAVRQITFAPNMFDARFGDRLAGHVHLDSAVGASIPSGILTLSALGTTGRATIPIGRWGSVLVAGRQGPPTNLYERFIDQFTGDIFEPSRTRTPRWSSPIGSESTGAGFRDLTAAVEVTPTPQDRLLVSVYDGRDDSAIAREVAFEPITGIAPPPVVDLPADSVVRASVIQAWEGRGTSGVWDRRWSPTVTTRFSVGRSEFASASDRDYPLIGRSTGVDVSFAAGRGGRNGFVETNTIHDTTVHAEATVAAGFAHGVTFGLETRHMRAEYASQRETFTPGTQVSALKDFVSRNGDGTTVSGFVQDAWRPMGQLVLTPGLRLSRYSVTGKTYLEPRISVSHPIRWAQIHGGWALTHQAANRIVREDRVHGDSEFWTLADGVLIPVVRAHQVTVGATASSPRAKATLQLFYRDVEDLTLLAPRLFPGIAPSSVAPLFHRGSSTAKGAEFMAQHEAPGNSLWASYRVSRVEHAFPTLEYEPFPASHDRLQELKLVDVIRLARGWSISGTMVAASGQPQTSADASEPVLLPTADRLFVTVFEPKNSDRLPAYLRIDLSTQLTLRRGRVSATTGVTVFNVFDRVNPRRVEPQAAGSDLAEGGLSYMRRAIDVFLRFGF